MPANHKQIASAPIFFKRNRVSRVYDGGKLFGDFFGDEPVDGKQPEEWVASTVKALNRDSSDPLEGLSVVEGTDIPFSRLIEEYPELLQGDKNKFDILVKVLDSAIRLPIQVHPDKDFSLKHFNSNYGKTEMWLILATRENAKICFGFKDKLSKAEFAMAVEKSRYDKGALTPLLNEIAVQQGEVYLIPARCVHAIGYGCLILEVQEPTDFTIQPEYWCGDYLLNDYEMYLGLDKEIALDCFDFNVFGEKSIALAKKEPVIIEQKADYIAESLISFADTPCFSAQRHTLTDSSMVLGHAPAIYIVTAGSGQLTGSGNCRNIQKGSYFFLPHCAANKFTVTAKQTLQLVCCLPPQ